MVKTLSETLVERGMLKCPTCGTTYVNGGYEEDEEGWHLILICPNASNHNGVVTGD